MQIQLTSLVDEPGIGKKRKINFLRKLRNLRWISTSNAQPFAKQERKLNFKTSRFKIKLSLKFFLSGIEFHNTAKTKKLKQTKN